MDTIHPHGLFQQAFSFDETDSSQEQKTCKGPCGRTLPATTEHFYANPSAKSGFDAKCKQCRKAYKKPTVPEGYKQCTGPCGRVLPVTKEYFYSHRKRSGETGFHAQCKQCIRANQKENPPLTSAERYKKCTGPCGRELPATLDFWQRDAQKKDGLTYRCKDCLNAWQKEYYENPEVNSRRIAYQKAYYESSPEVRERTKAYTKARRQRPEVREKRREEGKIYRMRPEVRERYKIYKKEYYRRPEVQDRNRAHSHNRRARIKSIKGNYTPQQIKEQMKRQRHKCYYCQKRFQKVEGRYIYHIDHTFPISRVAGTDIPANDINYLVLACPHCNTSKKDKFPWEFPEGGRLV